MEREVAEQIEQHVEEADARLHEIEHLLEGQWNEENCDHATAELLPFLIENPLYAFGWHRIAELARGGSSKNVLTLDETELALRWACFLNYEWPQPLIELGDLLLTDRNDGQAALEAFRTAMEMAQEQLEDAYVGMIDALNAVGDQQEFKRVVEECHRFFPDSEKIREAIDDWQAETTE